VQTPCIFVIHWGPAANSVYKKHAAGARAPSCLVDPARLVDSFLGPSTPGARDRENWRLWRPVSALMLVVGGCLTFSEYQLLQLALPLQASLLRQSLLTGAATGLLSTGSICVCLQ
jgi:hypothetical protein